MLNACYFAVWKHCSSSFLCPVRFDVSELTTALLHTHMMLPFLGLGVLWGMNFLSSASSHLMGLPSDIFINWFSTISRGTASGRGMWRCAEPQKLKAVGISLACLAQQWSFGQSSPNLPQAGNPSNVLLRCSDPEVNLTGQFHWQTPKACAG